MNALSAVQSNAMSDGSWDAFANHRLHVTALLLDQHQRIVKPTRSEPAWTPRGTLCLLGAGNSNDVDMRKLLRRYERIELVDIDDAALARGIARQFSTADDRVRPHGGIDLFGVEPNDGHATMVHSGADGRVDGYVAHVAGGAHAAAPSRAHVAATIHALARGHVAATMRTLLSRRCDVVSAMSFLPMLVLELQKHLGLEQMPVGDATHDWDEALDALCESYLRSLIAAVRPGGAVVHVSTLVVRRGVNANDTFSEATVLREHVERGDFFPATNPYYWLAMDGGRALHSAALWPGRARGVDRSSWRYQLGKDSERDQHLRRSGSDLRRSERDQHGKDSELLRLDDAHPYWVWRSSLTYGVAWIAG